MQAHLIRVSGKYLLDRENVGNVTRSPWQRLGMAGFEPLCSGATRVCLELSLVQFLVLHIHQETLSELSPPRGKNENDTKYKDICKNKSLPHCRSLCPRCPFWRAKSNQSVSKDASFKQCWCELKTCSSEFSTRHQVWRSCRPRPGLL